MQFKKIALAVAATLFAGHAAAAAVTGLNVAAARTAGTLEEAWLSGASAPTFNVFLGFAKGCDVGTLGIFTNHTAAGQPGSLKDYTAYACVRGGNGDNVVDAGETIGVFYHTIKDGSFNAYAPHTIGTQLERVKNLGTATCSGTGSWDGSAYGLGTVPVKFSCQKVKPATAPDGAHGNSAVPDGGYSDVEAALFGADVSAYGTEAEAGVGQVFGVTVSIPLYRALQADQGLSDVDASTFDPANAPNITSSQYASIVQVSGGYQGGWDLLLPNTAPTGKPIYLMRRVPTSGTQASSNAFFLKNPCATGAASGALAPAVAADSTGTFIVTEDSSSSTLKTNITTAGNAGKFVIGVLSMENNWRTEAAANAGYRFLKLDGVHPEGNGDTAFARSTTVTSNYALAMEMKSFLATTAVGTFGETLITQINTALANPTDAAGDPACGSVPRGLFLNPAGGACTTGVETHKGTKNGNNCSPFSLFF